MHRPRLQTLILALIANLLLSRTAAAGLVGVSQIVISSAIPTFLQVSEVVATETGTGNNLALPSVGATAVGTVFGGGQGGKIQDLAIDGTSPASLPNIFHSETSDSSETLTITLQSPSELSAITIFGKTGGFNGRDIYRLNVLDTSGDSLLSASPFDATELEVHSVTVSFSNAPVPVPSSILLMSTGLFGLVAWRWRKEVQR